MENTSTIILIGPMAAGKTTIGDLLSKRLSRPRTQMDEIRFDYYREAGYDDDVARAKHGEGKGALIAYWKPFEAYAVERILADHPNSVIDFGAGHSVYEDETLFARVEKALAPYPNVVLLLPSPDIDESLAILSQRLRQQLAEEPDIDSNLLDEIVSLNDGFVRHPSNSKLAKITIYTKDKSPEETCDEIISRLK